MIQAGESYVDSDSGEVVKIKSISPPAKTNLKSIRIVTAMDAQNQPIVYRREWYPTIDSSGMPEFEDFEHGKKYLVQNAKNGDVELLRVESTETMVENEESKVAVVTGSVYRLDGVFPVTFTKKYFHDGVSTCCYTIVKKQVTEMPFSERFTKCGTGLGRRMSIV
eukprot:g1669.t1